MVKMIFYVFNQISAIITSQNETKNSLLVNKTLSFDYLLNIITNVAMLLILHVCFNKDEIYNIYYMGPYQNPKSENPKEIKVTENLECKLNRSNKIATI